MNYTLVLVILTIIYFSTEIYELYISISNMNYTLVLGTDIASLPVCRLCLQLRQTPDWWCDGHTADWFLRLLYII